MDDRKRPHDPERDARTGEVASAARIRFQAQWVDQQIRQAVERGDFDNLPGYGKPIQGLGKEHDPNWWLKQLVAREQLSVLPMSLQIRKEDAELDGLLDTLATEDDVRREVAEFNARVRYALYRPPEGPPVITRQRDPDAEVEAWAERRRARIAARRAAQEAAKAEPLQAPRKRRWWRRSGARRADSG